MDPRTIRAWWARRQGLDGSLLGRSASDVLALTGGVRSVGGANPYLALFARAGIQRAPIDSAANELSIHELPAARGCTYVVPAADFALALAAAREFSGSEMKTARKLGVTDQEVERLCAAVLSALSREPLTPDEIRLATGDASRSLGEEGRKKGLTTTLPLNAEAVHAELARRYFRWIGPATLAEFQWLSGLPAKVARAAVEPFGLVPLADGDERLLSPEDRDSLLSFTFPKQPQYALVASLDGISHLRRNVKTLLEPPDAEIPVFSEKSVKPLGSLPDLPSHAILDRGRLVGLWEYDPDSQSIAWSSFVPVNQDLRQAVRRMEEFIRTDLEDARSFSLDSPKSRTPRILHIRQAGLGQA